LVSKSLLVKQLALRTARMKQTKAANHSWKSAHLTGRHSRGTTSSFRYMIIHVTDGSDPRLDPFRWRDRQLASRLDRLDAVGAGMFVAEGDLVVDRAIELRYEAIALLCDEPTGMRLADSVDESVQVFIGSEQLRGDVTGLGVPLRATGLFRRPALATAHDVLSRATRVVVAEEIDNPTNLGAIVRSAVALGWDAIVLSAGSADPLARRAMRVSMGSGLSVPFVRLAHDENIGKLLQQHNYVSYAMTPDASATSLSSVTVSPGQKTALLLGSERDGLEQDTMTEATHVVRIPMHGGIDSLNVGAAAAIAMHALGPDSHHD
jgi:tRNA G18 (ribose-2'-O)-methylase SpoU